MEIWKPVVGWESYFEVSNYGNIRSIARSFIRKASPRAPEHQVHNKSRPIKQRIEVVRSNRKKYQHVLLHIKGMPRKKIAVHKLVAYAFLGPRPQGLFIDHKDRDTLNNNSNNLRYITRSENFINSKGWDEAKNVYFVPNSYPWRTSIYFQGKTHMLGSYVSRENALWVAHFFKRNLFLLK